MIDICLVNVGGHKKKVYQSLSGEFSACEPPFWIALTAGYLRKHGFNVEILDANGLNLDFEETISILSKKELRFIGIVVYSQQANCSSPIMVAVTELSRKIKKEIPSVPLIVSGWHPSTMPEATMEETGADYVIQGEGFKVFLELLKGMPVNDISGLWRRMDNQIQTPYALMPNIDDLSKELDTVAWDLIPWQTAFYRAFNWMCLADFSKREHYVSMYTSLGCPFNCDFCAIHATYGERKIRYWNTEWVLRQFDTLAREYNIYHVNLIDELFVFNKEHYLPIAEELLKREYKLNICAFVRVDAVARMSDDELELLKRAGFNWFKIGIETPVRKNLDTAGKGRYTKDDIRNVIGRIHKAGIDMCANYMFGFKEDDYETMQENFAFAMELNCVFPSFFCVMAIPGSKLYENAKRENIPLPDTWLGYAQQGYEFLPLPTKYLSSAQVLEFRDYAFTTYFDNPRYLNMIENKFGKAAREHIVAMNSHRLKRKILEDGAYEATYFRENAII